MAHDMVAGGSAGKIGNFDRQALDQAKCRSSRLRMRRLGGTDYDKADSSG